MPTLIKNGKNYSGTSVSLTQAEYDALTETQKNDGTVYFITDSDAVLDASDVSVGSGTVEDSIGSIAVIETSPATSAHAVGTYLVYNGQLYKVTSAIAVGETLTVGTNISATNVADALDSLSDSLIKSITYTGTTSSTGYLQGSLATFGLPSNAVILSAYLERGSFSVYRNVEIGCYGGAGYYLLCKDNGTAIASSSVSLIIYYVLI